jgi:hypothetical protein
VGYLPDPAAGTIKRVAFYGYELTTAHGSYVVSEGRVLDALDSTIVRVVTADGLAGFATASSVELGVSQCATSSSGQAC